MEQQRHLGKTAPSLYDLRNLFQVNVEEGRRLWAMVYLLHKYFGADGREEAHELLRRQSGSQEAPRMLGAFNEETPDWLSFFMFTYFTDRDGKMQLESLAQSGFDPLSRTCRFMLTEEAHHMFVGETASAAPFSGHARRWQRRASPALTTSRRCARWASSTCQRFRRSSISIIRFRSTCLGRKSPPTPPTPLMPASRAAIRKPRSRTITSCRARYPVVEWKNGRIVSEEMPALSAINMRLRDDYTKDAAGGVGRWNGIIAKTGIGFEMKLPHQGFHRQIGSFDGAPITPDGAVVSNEEWQARCDDWLPSAADGEFIQSLMKPECQPGKYAGWIAPPKVGIDNKPGDFEYVKLHMA